MLTIHSGGAEGADAAFGTIGTDLGFTVYAHTFAGHKTFGKGIKKVHNAQELEVANEHLLKANLQMCRSFPPRSVFVLRLLQRNYYQVINSDFVVAIAPLENFTRVKGGTGWATAMGINMDKPVFVFDDGNTNRWHVYFEGKFVDLFHEFNMPMPLLNGNFAGIGSRAITGQGVNAIKTFLSQEKQERNIEWYGRLL